MFFLNFSFGLMLTIFVPIQGTVIR